MLAIHTVNFIFFSEILGSYLGSINFIINYKVFIQFICKFIMDPTTEALEAALGLVRHLPTDDLKSLMNDDTRLTSMINDLPQVS